MCALLTLAGSTAGASGSRAQTGVSPAKATLATFAAVWAGHTRSLAITKSGKASESIGDGCCDPIIDLTFQLSNVQGTVTNATATVTVLSVRVRDKTVFTAKDPAPRVGDVGKLHLKNGVITESLTGTNYCSQTGKPTFACGA